METTKLYQLDVYSREWDATITSIDENGKVYLDRTAFFPEGGGQSCDTGILQIIDGKKPYTFDVIDVQEDGAEVVHTLKATEDSGNRQPKEGDFVHCSLNWERRFDNMQRHCGEHILSGIFYQECGGVNRGFHMGDEYMTIDISLEDEPTNKANKKPDELTYEMCLSVEKIANQVIWSNAPVRTFRFATRAEAEKMPLRKALAFDEDISIVCIGSAENAADCVACCGTHPKSAGQVGLIKIFKVEKNKGMFRVFFEAGERALNDYDSKHSMLYKLSNDYSSSIEDFPKKLRAQEEKLANAKTELNQLKRVLIESECAKLNEEIAASPNKVLVYKLMHLSLDDTFNMAKTYMGKPDCGGKLIMLYSVPDTSYVLVSDGKIKCGQLVKEYASFYQGKGGGNDISARAMFKTDEDAALFADLLGKHLQ